MARELKLNSIHFKSFDLFSKYLPATHLEAVHLITFLNILKNHTRSTCIKCDAKMYSAI